MIALVAALLLAQAPPAQEAAKPEPPPAAREDGAERRGDARKQKATVKRPAPEGTKARPEQEKPERKPTDAQVIRELELLERLPLLERLELFDPGGDAPGRKR